MERVFLTIHRHGIWRGGVWGLASGMSFDGAAYLALGNDASAGPSSSLLRTYPGGMRVEGAVMLILGLGLFFLTRDRGSKRSLAVLMATFVYSAWITSQVPAGWVHAHHAAVGGLTKWFLFMWWSLWLAVTALGGVPVIFQRLRRRSGNAPPS